RVALVPQRQGKAQLLLVVAESPEPVFAPPVRPRASLVVREVVPRVAILAVVLTDRAPLPLAEVRSPFLPGDLRFARLVQPVLLSRVCCSGGQVVPPSLVHFFFSWIVTGERSSNDTTVSAKITAASPRMTAPAPPPISAPTAATVPPPAMAPTAAPAPAPTPTFAASLPLLAAASDVTGDVTISLFRPSLVVGWGSAMEGLAFPLIRPPLSTSTMRPSILAPLAATTQPSPLIGSSRIAENTSPVLAVFVESSRVVLMVSGWPATQR